MNKDAIIQNYAREKTDVLYELQSEMMRVIDILMTEGEPDLYTDAGGSAVKWREQLIEYGEYRGQGQGLAYAIAVLEQVYAKPPDVPGVKERALKKWHEINGEGADDDQD